MGRKRKAVKMAKREVDVNANLNTPVPVESKSTENVQRSPTHLTSVPKESKDAIKEPKGTTTNKGLKASNKESKDVNAIVRRSGRLRTLVQPAPNKQMIPEEIDLVPSEQEEETLDGQEEEEPLDEQFNSEPPPTNLQSLESKIDFLVESVQEFKSEGTGRRFPSEVTYRSLYIEAKNKIEELTTENLNLAKKLEFARGKLEGLEQLDINLRSMKDMGLMTNLGRVTEAVVNLVSLAPMAKCNGPEEATICGAPAQPPLAAPENNNASPAPRKKYAIRKK